MSNFSSTFALPFIIAMTQKLTSFYTDTEGAIKSVRIYQVELRENLRALFPQAQSKLSVIMRHQY